MTQLALLLALGSIGLVASFALGRLEVRRGAVSPTLKRVEGAIERAAVTLLRSAGIRTLLLLSGVGAALAGCTLLIARPEPGASNAGRIAFMGVALLGGALSAFVHARLVVAFGARACSAATPAAARGSSRSLRPLLRASAAFAGFGEGLGLLSVGTAFAALYAVRGGFAQAAASPALAAEVVSLLPAFALGAAIAALTLTRYGAVLAGAALVGGSQAGEHDARLNPLDARNPATLAELLGEHVGGLLPRALSSYVAGVSVNVAAAALAVSMAARPSAGVSPLSPLLLILVVRAFGIVASVCGVFAARADENEAPERALLRGQLAALAVSVFGLGAGLYWLRVEGFSGLFVAGLVGSIIAALLTQVAWLPLRRATGRDGGELRLGDAAVIARGASSGLACLLPALLVPGLGLWLVEHLSSGAEQAAPDRALVVAAFVSGLIATAPFSIAVAGFGTLVEATQSAAGLVRLETESRHNGARLDEAGAIGGGAAGTHATLAVAASLLLGLFALQGGPSEAPSPGVLLSAALGAVALVLLFAARSARSALFGARAIAEEVRRQLQALPRRDGTLLVPAEFTPSYKACVDSAIDSARERSLTELGWAVLVPFALALALADQLALRPALLGFALSAVLCGLTFVLGSRGARAALREPRRRRRAADAAGPNAPGNPQNFGDLLGLSAAAGVEALIGVVALSALSLASLIG